MRPIQEDGRSRPAYEPSMMVALLLYAYARGVRSARAIERACEEDVAYRVIAAQQVPDHATIARFIERHERGLGQLFGAVLGLCARAGLVRSGLVAIDGTKLAANASREQTVDYERIAREILEEAKAVDAAEDDTASAVLVSLTFVTLIGRASARHRLRSATTTLVPAQSGVRLAARSASWAPTPEARTPQAPRTRATRAGTARSCPPSRD